LKLNILRLLEENQEMTLGQLKKQTKTAHHYTLLNALEFLEKINLVVIREKKDKLRSKMVQLTNH
jgi:DNA-binding HxlR family transcriptional regulator